MSFVASLFNSCIQKFIFNIGLIKKIINRLSKSGINIFIHRTTGPAWVHIRTLTGAHRDNKFFLVCIVLDSYRIYSIAWLCFFVKLVYCCSNNIFVRALYRDIPVSNFFVVSCKCSCLRCHRYHHSCCHGKCHNLAHSFFHFLFPPFLFTLYIQVYLS